jgi:UDP-glucose:(heptosyl)LPS alpha-1,3-glucosyltransferase
MQNSSKRHFISVSGYLSRNIEQCYPLIKNISIAHPGISEKFIQNESNKDKQFNSLKRELSIPENSFVILLVANNYQKKGLPTILKALEELKNNNIYLVIAGQGEQKNTYISKSICHNIYFLGPINNMANLYCQVDLLAHPTLADTFGMAPLEAMSVKLPVIISNMKYCGFSEYLNDSQALILDDPKDEIELASKINFLYENIEEREKIAQNGYELSKKISWENTLHKTLLAYNLIKN